LTGKVQDAYGRPPVVGTSVQARADGVPCQGTGRTENLYWMPKAPNAQAVGIKGFYFIPIEMVPGCVDRTVTFKVTVVGSSAAATIAVTTPEYGRAVEVPGLVLPARPD
jgi:hypothetical protein